MSDDDTVGFGRPPKQSQWTKGQSGNPRGRPKSRVEHVIDAARILAQPVEARGPDGATIRLEAVEAAYLSLCKNGLKGHKISLLEAIRIMLELGPALRDAEQDQKATRDRVLEAFERMGVNLSSGSSPRD
ncbi:DUF5681 domain-containing protein [Roseovarius sp. MS2]|uniref:DUF5681 domain-containing protein n=1 Tax=Roseovarius sp. MS2 TaxID=3390728 RepID=UPI003EDB8AB4